MNESRQTVETDIYAVAVKNIRALNFRKPGHLRKYCNNENFPIYGIYFPHNSSKNSTLYIFIKYCYLMHIIYSIM